MNCLAYEFLARDKAGLLLTKEGEWLGTYQQWTEASNLEKEYESSTTTKKVSS